MNLDQSTLAVVSLGSRLPEWRTLQQFIKGFKPEMLQLHASSTIEANTKYYIMKHSHANMCYKQWFGSYKTEELTCVHMYNMPIYSSFWA